MRTESKPKLGIVKFFVLLVMVISISACNKEDSVDDSDASLTADTSVSLDKTTLSLAVGDTYTLTATVSTSTAVVWSSSNSAVATVVDGKVTAKAIGNSEIRVTSDGKTAICAVTVVAKENIPVFTDNTAFDIPNLYTSTAIKNIDVSVGVTGGKKPYVFSAIGLPAGITISSTGVIKGTPTALGSAGTATITVKDSALKTASITINFGSVNTLVKYPVYVGNVQVTNANESDVLKDGKVVYNSTLKKLTLKGAYIDGAYYLDVATYTTCGIFADGDLTIEMAAGTQSSVSRQNQYSTFGVYVTGVLTFTGTGNFVCLSQGQSYGFFGNGIYAQSIAFNGGSVDITAEDYAISPSSTLTAASNAVVLKGNMSIYPYSGTLNDLKSYSWGRVTIP